MIESQPITFYLKGGSKVEVVALDQKPNSDIGIQYDFIIHHPNGTSDSFIYTPVSSMSEKQKEMPALGVMNMHEQEALLIFQNKYE